jgi:hypothetical protein
MDGGARLCLVIGGLAAAGLAAFASPVAASADPGHPAPPGRANGLHQSGSAQGSATPEASATSGPGGGNSASSHAAESNGGGDLGGSADKMRSNDGEKNHGASNGGASDGHHNGQIEHTVVSLGTTPAGGAQASEDGILAAVLGAVPASAPAARAVSASTLAAHSPQPGAETAPPPPAVGPTTSPPPVGAPGALTGVRVSILAGAVVVLALAVIAAVRAATGRGGRRR